MKTGDVFNPIELFCPISLPKSFIKLTTISSDAKLCWGRLKSYSERDGSCYPKQEQLSEELGMSLSRLRRAIDELEENKFIQIKRPSGFNKLMHKNNQYFFLLHECLSPKIIVTEDNPVSVTGDSPRSHRWLPNITINSEATTVNDFEAKASHHLQSVSDETQSSRKTSGFFLGTLKKRSLTKDLLPKIPEKDSTKKTYDRTAVTSGVKSILKRQNEKLKQERAEKRKAKLKPPLPVSPQVQEIWNLWESAGFPISNTSDLSYNDDVKACNHLLKGKIPEITKVPSMPEIYEAIERFKLAAFDNEFLPEDPVTKKKMQKKKISRFIYNGFASFEKSLLKKYLVEEPKLRRQFENQVEDKWPNGSKAIGRFYREHARGTLKESYSVQDIDKFRKASNMCMEFYDKHEHRMRGVNGYPMIQEYLCNAVWEAWGRDPMKLNTGSFCTQFAKDRLLAALTAEGLIEESNMGRGSSIYELTREQEEDEIKNPHAYGNYTEEEFNFIENMNEKEKDYFIKNYKTSQEKFDFLEKRMSGKINAFGKID